MIALSFEAWMCSWDSKFAAKKLLLLKIEFCFTFVEIQVCSRAPWN